MTKVTFQQQGQKSGSTAIKSRLQTPGKGQQGQKDGIQQGRLTRHQETEQKVNLEKDQATRRPAEKRAPGQAERGPNQVVQFRIQEVFLRRFGRR